ncbi:TIM-barrel domain-containing protein [Marinilabilia salmonicolor]|uniref:TIM-barrel domain-containing protein n=1 Tax=Marinilabilia salmonicolor TaxID=989 RepID=UPI001902B16B|nr:TIM-barrel domain-containing protein [Marinilabilia salmonicolor]
MAYGFWQCRERYTSGKQLVETVEKFRKRELPMDVIVQDWQYWGNKVGAFLSLIKKIIPIHRVSSVKFMI